MDWSRLAKPLADAGLTLLGSVLGGPAGGIAVAVGREVLGVLGVATPQEAARVLESDPRAREALADYQRAHAEELALLAQEQQHMSEILAREDKAGLFHAGWRPAMMWLLAFLWLSNLFLIPVLFNAVLGLGVPLAPFDALITLTGIYMALYMGGHTIKQVTGK